VAQVGDTRAILFRNQYSKGMLNKKSYLELVKPHVPSRLEEKMRIYRNGGEIR
jgi:serine/threonine protein phosphatase PrpC